MNKKTSLILLLLIVGVLLIIAFIQIQKQLQNYEMLDISLGEEFTLHENQSAIIEDENYEIKITKFFNSPCPQDLQFVACFWSGVGIGFEYTHNGEVKKGISLVQAFGYQTTIIDTDYETYAKLKITKME